MYAKYCGRPTEEIDVCPNVGWIADFGDPQAVLDMHVQRQEHQLHRQHQLGPDRTIPEINAAMDAAESVVGTGARATRGREIDSELVAQAAAIPFDWDKQPNIESSEVAGVGELWNTGPWDYSLTSLKWKVQAAGAQPSLGWRGPRP